MTDTQQFKVIIVGAGLSGSCLANGLVNKGIAVTIYERLREDAKREGYQVRLGADALKGLRECLTPEHLQHIVNQFGPASGVKGEAPVLKDHRFQTMLDLTMFPTYNKSAPISRVALRSALAAPLSAAGKLKYNKQFQRYEIVAPGTAQEQVRVWFEDGTNDVCDVLIAADGNHSKINQQIGLDNIADLPQFTNMIAKGQLSTSRLRATNPQVIKTPVLALAQNKALYHCAYLPKSSDKNCLSDEGNSFSMFSIHMPSSTCPKDLPQRSKEEIWDFVGESLSSWSSEYHDMINLARDCDPYFYNARASTNPGLRWRVNLNSKQNPELGNCRVWVIGDAMHAMLPNRGMGGNTAIRDTAVALPLLARLAKSAQESGRVMNTDVERACQEFEAEMIPRAFAWVAKSGGKNLTPVDASTILGRAFFALAAVVMQISYYIYAFSGIFVKREFVDDAPELR